MRLVDANVLLYAANGQAHQHEVARAWLRNALQGPQTLLVPWLSAMAFLRISTHAGINDRPLTVAQAVGFLRRVLLTPVVIPGEPDSRHLDRISGLLAPHGGGGNLVNDAHLAALALQYDATVISYDNDFARFPGVRWQQPTDPARG